MGCGQGKIRIVGICGSLRGASTNGALLQFLRSLPSDQVQIDIQHVGFLPLFNEDLEKEKSKRSINNLEVPTSV
jgi:NAD(P)H-dependent FMN reductase